MNLTDNDGQTPAHGAAASGNVECLRMLKMWDADMTRPDNNGRTPVSLARMGGHTECVELLTEVAKEATEVANDKQLTLEGSLL